MHRSTLLALGIALTTAAPAGAATAHAPARTPMRIGVALARPHAAAEARLLHALYDPSSPRYHRFLTPQAFARRFGVGAGRLQRTEAWLRRSGLRVQFVSRSHDYVLAAGDAAAVHRAMGVTMLRFTQRGHVVTAADRAPRVPAGLGVLEILGLDSRQQHQPLAVRPGATPHTGDLSPQDLWSVYDQPAASTGQNVSVGIIGAGDTKEPIAHLKSFDKKYAIPAPPVSVVQTPATGDYSYTGVAGEWDLDVAAVSGMAPGLARMVLYASPTYRDTDLVGSLAAWTSDPTAPPIMNESYGECERGPANPVLTQPQLQPLDGNEYPVDGQPQSGLANSAQPAEDQILKQAVIMGRTLFASAGDSGAGCTMVYPPVNTNGVLPQPAPLTEDPSDSPYAVGVGGTVLYTDGNQPAGRFAEYTWTFSGGNASPFIPAPDYQQGVSGINRPCVTDADGNPTNTGQLCRGVPDVAALSGDVTGRTATTTAAARACPRRCGPACGRGCCRPRRSARPTGSPTRRSTRSAPAPTSTRRRSTTSRRAPTATPRCPAGTTSAASACPTSRV